MLSVARESAPCEGESDVSTENRLASGLEDIPLSVLLLVVRCSQSRDQLMLRRVNLASPFKT